MIFICNFHTQGLTCESGKGGGGGSGRRERGRLPTVPRCPAGVSEAQHGDRRQAQLGKHEEPMGLHVGRLGDGCGSQEGPGHMPD